MAGRRCQCAATLRPVLIERRARDGILDGSITMLFRRWRRPQVVGGRRYRTTAGLLAVETVDVLNPADITEDDARAAGYDSAAAAVAELRGAPDLPSKRTFSSS